MGPSHWKGFRRSGECLRWGGKGLRMSRNCLIRDNKGLSQDMKKKEKEKKLTEKFPYGLVLYIVVPYEAATQKGKNVA